jgi:hypothetical protein
MRYGVRMEKLLDIAALCGMVLLAILPTMLVIILMLYVALYQKS